MAKPHENRWIIGVPDSVTLSRAEHEELLALCAGYKARNEVLAARVAEVESQLRQLGHEPLTRAPTLDVEKVQAAIDEWRNKLTSNGEPSLAALPLAADAPPPRTVQDILQAVSGFTTTLQATGAMLCACGGEGCDKCRKAP